MRWNPFRRQPVEDSTDSAFEATVAEDLASVAGLPEATATRPAGPAVETVGEKTLPVKRKVIGHVGRYALKAVLGEGGLGTVYAAWDPLLSRAVAVKTLHLHAAESQAVGALDDMILNEARAAARLSHPHIVTVFDAGPSDQGIYIAMEPLRGRDLRHMLQEGWRPNPVEATQIVRRVADALAYAHSKGVVHCDIKPANIFMVGRKQPKVLDFGIARIAHRETPTVEGQVAGSPYYLAPEQLRGETVDRRCDVYSLGVVLFELLTLQRPFTGSTLDDINRAVLNAPTPQARQVNGKVPTSLSAIVARAMAREPGDRYPSARHFSMELRHWLELPEARALAESPESARRRRLTIIGVGFGAAALAAAVQTAWRPFTSATSAPAALPAAASAPAADAASAALQAAAVSSAPASAPEPVASAPVAADTAASAAIAEAEPAAPEPARAKPAATRDKKPKPVVAAPTVVPEPTPVAPPPPGTLQLAVSPWGQVEVDGQVIGIAPPVNRLSLPAGTHTITIRNGELPPLVRTVEISAEKPVVIKHRFDQ